MQLTEAHICIYAYVRGPLYAWMQMRHAQPGSTVRNLFPTLVMDGIVNSIASELDSVGASRKSQSDECSLRHVPSRERELRSVGASVK